MKSQPFPSTPRHPWARDILGISQPLLNEQNLNSLVVKYISKILELQ